MKNSKYLILRRVVQVSIILLYLAGNYYGWKILEGNLSTSLVFGKIPLSDPYAVLQMFVAGAVISSNLLIGAIIILLFYGVLGGRAFCSWVCPVNIITDAANWTRRKFGFDMVAKKTPISRSVRYWVIVISLIISYFLGLAAFEFISPISMVHRGLIFGMGFGWAAMIVIYLFDLFVLKNGWCGHICPLGGFYATIGKFRLLKVKHDSDACTGCMKCKVVCPESQVLHMIDKESLPVLSGECTNCGRCIDVCDDNALGFFLKVENNKKGEKNNEKI
ncbi:MAG: quinol dehydrogenase ferredoxin subunit NapH [Epsilonproteobacteria bacterium]|nr:quinol dehydrogenase ferredoxin subunit NapH [Campylobacterota bacterium]